MKTFRDSIKLIEMAPYVDPKPMSRDSLRKYPVDPDGTISISAIERSYSVFDAGIIIPGLATIILFISNNKNYIIGIDNRELDKDRAKVMFRLDLNTKFKIPGFSNPIQIDEIVIDEKYESYGVAKAVYTRLANIGYSVVSDNTQHEPAVGLWKSLAKNPNTTVYVVDVHRGPLMSDDKMISYDGENIRDNQIWTTGGNYNGLEIVLVLV